jgi:lipopolysaccharide/colanic/teichoic acid biosynthesis glycosyltransferase
MKRGFDIVASFTTLLLMIPLLALVSTIIKLDSEGPVFFKQERMGRGFRPFRIYKFRTMKQTPVGHGSQVTVGDDPRITRVGRFLRQAKLDEIPQLINILRGEMSFVGPRPEVPQYVQLYKQDYQEILTVRPGLTDLASLKYRDEAALLARATNPEEEYTTRVLPDKIELAKDYLRQASLLFDLKIIFKTLFKLFEFRTTS